MVNICEHQRREVSERVQAVEKQSSTQVIKPEQRGSVSGVRLLVITVQVGSLPIHSIWHTNASRAALQKYLMAGGVFRTECCFLL